MAKKTQKPSEFALRKAAMHEFLVSRLEGLVDVTPDSFLLDTGLEHRLEIFAIKGKAHFKKILGFTYERNDWIWDNEAVELEKLYAHTKSFIHAKNTAGVIPGFVFLQSETDFVAAAKQNRVRGQLVNKRGSNKQVLANGFSPTFFDTRVLRRDEAIVRDLYARLEHPLRYDKAKSKGIYTSELIHMNMNKVREDGEKGVVELVTYVDHPLLSFYDNYDECPHCQRTEAQAYEHGKHCTGTYNYDRYAMQRSFVRFQKKIKIMHAFEGKFSFSPARLLLPSGNSPSYALTVARLQFPQ